VGAGGGGGGGARDLLSWSYSYAVCMWVTVQYVMLLSRCLIAICFTPFALRYVLINCIILIIHFTFVFLFGKFYFLFSEFCVFILFCVLFLSMYVVVYFLVVCSFTDHCHRKNSRLLSNGDCEPRGRLIIHLNQTQSQLRRG